MSEPTCAVWYWSHGSTGFSLFDSEAEAVEWASYDTDAYAVNGIQYADGTYVARDDWKALDDYEREQAARIWADLRAPDRKPDPTVHSVTPPFDGPAARTTEAVPTWLGKRR